MSFATGRSASPPPFQHGDKKKKLTSSSGAAHTLRRQKQKRESSGGNDMEAMKAKANLLVLERWRKRHQQAIFATHKSLCRVPKTLAHAKESEGTYKFLSYLFRASAGDDVSLSTNPTATAGAMATSFSSNAERYHSANNNVDTSNATARDGRISLGASSPAQSPSSSSFQSSSAPAPPPPLVLDIPDRLRPHDLVSLNAVASTHPTLRAVLLRENDLDSLTYQALSKVLKANPSITHIGWKGHCAKGDGSRDPRRRDDESVHPSSDDDEDYDDRDDDEYAEEDSDAEDDGFDQRALATINRMRKQMLREAKYPEGEDREARLVAFLRMGGASGQPDTRNSGGAVTPPSSPVGQSRHNRVANAKKAEKLSERRQKAAWVKKLRAQLYSNRQHVAAKHKRDWIEREVALYKKSVDVFCEFMQRFVIAERSLRSDLMVMEERQRAVLIATLNGNKREALRRDKSQRLLKSIEDRLVWVAGRESSFRQLLWDDYHDECLDFTVEMEISRRSAMVETEANARVIIRSIGNASWAVAMRAEKARKEAQRLAKLAHEEDEDAARLELWQQYARDLRRLKRSEGEGRDAATVAAVYRMDKERREAANAKRLEELAKEKEAREARELAQQHMLAANGQRRNRERMAAHDEQWRNKFSGVCDDFLTAMRELRSCEGMLFSSEGEGSKADATHYLQLLNVTLLSVLKANAAAEMLGFSLNLSMTFAFDTSSSSMPMAVDASSPNQGSITSPTSPPLTNEARQHDQQQQQQINSLLASSVSLLPQNIRWVQLLSRVGANVKLPPARPRVPPCSFNAPLAATELFAESALERLEATGLLVSPAVKMMSD